MAIRKVGELLNKANKKSLDSLKRTFISSGAGKSNIGSYGNKIKKKIDKGLNKKLDDMFNDLVSLGEEVITS